MAIDRKKMAAFAGHADSDEQPKDPDHPGKNKPGKGAGDGGGGDDDMQEGGDGKFGALIPLLEANAEELEACCDELDPDSLDDTGTELSEDDHDTLMDSFNDLDGGLKKAMKSALPGIQLADAQNLAEHLSSEDMIEDEEKVAGLIFRFGQVLKGGDAGEGDEHDGDDDTGDVDDDKPSKPPPPKGGGKPGGGGGKPPFGGKQGGKPGGSGKAPPFGKKPGG